MAELQDGAVRECELHPEEAGLPVHPFEDDPRRHAGARTASAFRALLDGARGAYRDAVLLNAAAALVVAGAAPDLKEGVARAAELLDAGKARAKAEALARITSS